MNRSIKNIIGVTLLEIMLVLAIAAMVIIMSIRYYQSSSSSQQVNATMEQIQAIASSMDNIANGGGGDYSGITSTTLEAVMGSANMKSPTNAAITFTAGSATTYGIQIPLTDPICTAVLAKLPGLPKVTNPGCSSGTLQYTYDNTK